MSRTFVASFLVTAGVAIPAAWHLTDANIHSDGKKLRPMQQSLVIDGARVTLDVNHSLVTTGDKVTATLHAFSDTPKQVAVDLTLLQTHNYEGERVGQPWIAIDHEKLVIEANARGGRAVTTQLELGHAVDTLAQTDSFKVVIAAPGLTPPKSEMWPKTKDWDVPISDGTAAAVAIMGWSGNSYETRIVPEGKVTGNEPFTVAVHIKNTGNRLPHRPWIQLDTELDNQGNLHTSDAFSIEESPTDADKDVSDHDRPFKHGQELVKRFIVTPTDIQHGTITFVAQSTAWDEAPGPTIGGSMEVKTFKLHDESKEVASK